MSAKGFHQTFQTNSLSKTQTEQPDPTTAMLQHQHWCHTQVTANSTGTSVVKITMNEVPQGQVPGPACASQAWIKVHVDTTAHQSTSNFITIKHQYWSGLDT